MAVISGMMLFQQYLLLLLLTTLVLHIKTTTAITAALQIYYVTPNNNFTLNNYTNTLQHYLNNSKRYFTSFTQLHFLPGTHFLNDNLIIKHEFNFTLSGNSSVIDCNNKHVGIFIKDVKGFTMHNITIVQCNMKMCSDTVKKTWIAALILQYCSLVVISNVSITINSGINGLLAISNKMEPKLTNLMVCVKCTVNNSSLPNTNGMVFYNYDQKNGKGFTNVSYYVSNYTYIPDILCSKISPQYAINIVLTQSKYNTYIKISNTTFSNLHNITILNYYGKSYEVKHKIWNILAFYNCMITRNTGNSLSSMFSYILHGNGYAFGSEFENYASQGHNNILKFNYCDFFNNSNFKSLLHISTINTLSLNTIMKINHCNIYHNHMVTVMEITSKVKVLWQMSLFINIASTNMSFNKHIDGVNLISTTNSIIKLSGLVTIQNNSYYYSIFMLRMSLLKFYGESKVYGNQVRHVFKGKEGSYYLVNEYSKITITHNTVFNVLSQSEVYDEHYQQICYFQFFSRNGSLDELINQNKNLSYEIVMLDNIYTAPLHMLNISSTFPNDCTWLAGTAFNEAKSSDVYNRTVNRTIKGIDKRNIGIIPSSICHCVNSTKYECTSHELGTIYPGQNISTKLIIPRLISISQNYIILTALNKNLPPYGCEIIRINEISQTHFKSDCNKYNYTIWSDKDTCEIYLSSTDSMEIFYVNLLPCPLGFSLQKDKQGCACDIILNSDIISVTSCNLDDATILRPANSWIFATKYNNTQIIYKVSSHCPFDYCLQHASNINLSNPDSQCQFKRSGVLCGYCPKGLSAVFGSSQCKHCSNIYLLIIIPIAIAGIVLVTILFIFNITINNGVICTFIFYVNIISINFSMFFPRCQSVVCVLISLANLDLGIETCFYDGMDEYAKMWLQLAFPFYLLLIAHLLIIGSRYSVRIQRLTARRALPVLATLLLLSYTKILLTVCRVLFFFSRIVYLPGKHVKYTWSVDTNIRLFGAKFSILFATCLILFIILLPFNILLLFTRVLSRFKLINSFKPLLDAYFGPYKDKFYYWTGLYLLMRATFFGLSAFRRNVNFNCGIILLGILLCIQGVTNPFKCKLTNIQESFILLNLLLVYVVAHYSNNNTGIQLQIVQFLIIIIFIYFAIFITCHCLMSTCGKTIRNKTSCITVLWKNHTAKNESHSKTQETCEMNIDITSGSYSEYQEPLIALDTHI